MRSAIETKRVRISGTLGWDSNGTISEFYWDPEASKYVGEPSPDMDRHWHRLIYRSSRLPLVESLKNILTL